MFAANKRHAFSFHESLKNEFGNFATDPPLLGFFGLLKGGGSLENPEPSGACGGLSFITMFLLSNFRTVWLK